MPLRITGSLNNPSGLLTAAHAGICLKVSARCCCRSITASALSLETGDSQKTGIQKVQKGGEYKQASWICKGDRNGVASPLARFHVHPCWVYSKPLLLGLTAQCSSTFFWGLNMASIMTPNRHPPSCL